MNKRIVLVGPTAGGKTFLRKKLEKRGFKCDVSYTTRKPRPGEEYGVHYNFISEDEFTLRISQGAFYEHVEYNGNRYGTGLYEWNNLPLFIMETDGIAHIKPEDRLSCFIIYINPPEEVRIKRMKEDEDRQWDDETIRKRIETDNKKFGNFTDYDIEITTENF